MKSFSKKQTRCGITILTCSFLIGSTIIGSAIAVVNETNPKNLGTGAQVETASSENKQKKLKEIVKNEEEQEEAKKVEPLTLSTVEEKPITKISETNDSTSQTPHPTPKDVSAQTRAEILLLSNQAKVIANRISMLTMDSTIKLSDGNNNLIAPNRDLTLGNNIDNDFIIWSKLGYDYYNGSDIDSFSTPSVIVGGEYDFGKNKALVSIS